MAKRPLIEAEKRKAAGTRAVRRLRAAGKIPAIIYGPGVPTEMLTVDAEVLNDAVENRARMVDLKIGAEEQSAVIKEVQFDHLGSDIQHVDFERINLTETVRVAVPIETHGTAKGTRNGGVLEITHHRVRVECKASDVPNEITVEVAGLDIGDSVTIGQLPLPEGVKVIDEPSTIVLHVLAPRKPEEEEVEAVEEEQAEPEVIGAKKEEEEDQKEE